MAERDLLPQALNSFGPQITGDIEDLYGLRSEEFLRGIAPDVANRIYGPRTRISPQAAAELKVDLAKTYKDLAKVSQDGSTASASDRVKLAIAALQAGAKTEAASITARAGITRMEMSGQFNLALENLKQADDALGSLGPISTADRDDAARVANAVSGTALLQELPRADLFEVGAAGTQAGQDAGLQAAQDAAYNQMRQIIAEDPDPERVARITAQVATTMGTTPERVKNMMVRKAGARGDRAENVMVTEAYEGEASTSAMEALARYERSTLDAQSALQAGARKPGGTGAQSFLNIGLAALEPGPAGVQVDNDTLRSLGVTAEQLQDPNATNDIQSAAQAQIENLFTAIDEGAAATPYMQQKVDAIKESARIEGSEFREFLKQSGLDPDSPAAVDVGFQLLEDEYAEVRKYETRQAKMQANVARRQRRLQRAAQRQRDAEGELAAGTVQAGPDPMMPIDQELEMMEQQALQRQGQTAPAAEAPAAEAPAAPDPEEADLVQRGLILEGTKIIPLGKLEGDNTYEYAFDAATNEFIGYQPGQDPQTGNRFSLETFAEGGTNPRLVSSLANAAASRVAEAQGPAPQEAPTQEAQGADPAVQREGIGVRRSQTENMQTIEKRLRAAARAARKRGNEESANNLEEEADRYLTLESGVVYRDEEARAQGVGTGFEQEEALPGDERFSIGAIPEDVDQYEVPEEKQTLEDLIPEDQPSQPIQTRLRPQPLEPIENLLRTEEEKAEMEEANPPEFEGQPGTEPTLSQFERSRSLMGLPAGFIPQTNKPASAGNTGSLQEAAAKRLEEMKKRKEQSSAGAAQ